MVNSVVVVGRVGQAPEMKYFDFELMGVKRKLPFVKVDEGELLQGQKESRAA